MPQPEPGEALILADQPAPVPAMLHPSVAAEYVRDFNLERVAKMFNTTPNEIRAVLNSDKTQQALVANLGDVSQLGAIAQRRLLEALLQEAMSTDESKGRTEARKLLARHFLPTRTEVKSEHTFYVQTPGKMAPDEWTATYGTPTPVLDAEIIEDT